MLFVYVSDVQQIAEQPFNLSSHPHVGDGEILEIALVNQIILCRRHRIDILLLRILNQVFFSRALDSGPIR